MDITFHKTLLGAALTLATLQAPAFADDQASTIARGAQLASFGGCADCHMPLVMGPDGPQKDVTRGLSGHPEGLLLPPPPALQETWNWAGAASMTAFTGPWGTSYATNLTPDEDTGLGRWRAEDFIQAMRTGKHIGVGRPILPPMPWQSVGTLPDDDLRALYTYLMSQPPVKNRVPESLPPTP